MENGRHWGGTPEAASRVCGETATLARRAVDWLARPGNRARAGQSFDSLDRQIRRSMRTAERLRRAAANPASVAVYGASQAGKSFLIAHLAAPPTGSTGAAAAQTSAMVLPAARPGGIPFLDINPAGGRESTGLVTRFTKRPSDADPAFPVRLKLLTALDLVKILIGCYLVDLDQVDEAPMDEKAIADVIGQVAKLPRSAPRCLNGDDIFELKELCLARYGHLPNVTRLKGADYWDLAAPLVEGLDTDALTRLLEPMWNGVARFSLLFRRLYGALTELGFAEEVRCPIEALLPRTDEATGKALSIIDVQTLYRVLGGASEPIPVRHRNGTSQLDRPVVTALAAELVLDISGATRPFLDRLDLLDFPGARSRGGLKRSKLDEKEGTEEVFLRGKVALLFDRYRDEYDLTSMLLCVGPSTSEVLAVPTLINQWVEDTHGATPEIRSRTDTTLFLVLTKFDMQFEIKGGDTSPTDRWKARIDASITSFLGRIGNWVREWHPGRPFDNVFWYRNPFVEQPGLVTTEPIGAGPMFREVALNQSRARFIEELRDAYAGVAEVRRHFADPEAAWNAVITLNDGGITYIADRIAAIGQRDVKLAQIEARITAIRTEIGQALRPFHFDADPKAQRETRLRDANKIAQELWQAGLHGSFGRFLARLVVVPEELERLYRSVRLREGNGERAPPQPPPAPTGSKDPDAFWKDLEKGKRPAPAAQRPPATTTDAIDCTAPSLAGQDLATRFACRVYSHWSERVHEVCRHPGSLEHFGLSSDGAQTLATELIAGSRRARLVDAVATGTRPATRIVIGGADLGAPTPSLIAARTINDFVAFLAARAAAAGDADGPRFAFGTGDRDEPLLGEEPQDTAVDYCRAWLLSFRDLVEGNASSALGVNFDIAENDALSAILVDLTGAPPDGARP